jgi:hypothetical protein
MLLTVEISVFITIFFLAYGLAVARDSRAKVKVRASDSGGMTLEPALGQQKKVSRFKEASVELLAKSGQWALPNLDKVSEMRKSLIQGGFRHPQAPAVYLGLRVLTGFLLPLPVLLTYVVRGKMNVTGMLIALGVSIVGC